MMPANTGVAPFATAPVAANGGYGYDYGYGYGSGANLGLGLGFGIGAGALTPESFAFDAQGNVTPSLKSSGFTKTGSRRRPSRPIA